MAYTVSTMEHLSPIGMASCIRGSFTHSVVYVGFLLSCYVGSCNNRNFRTIIKTQKLMFTMGKLVNLY